MQKNRNFSIYKEFKKNINLMEVAAELGYKLVKSDGLKWPTMVKTDGGGRKIDSIVICHPESNENMGFFRHGGNSGDVINFVREHLNELQHYGKTEIEILKNLSKVEDKQKDISTAATWVRENYKNRKFDLSGYNLESLKNRVYLMNFLLKARGINQRTAELFSDNLIRVTHWVRSNKEGEKPWLATNLGFPYRVPGQKDIVGLELRHNGFKSKVAGSNSSDAVWSADFCNNNPNKVKYVYFAESPFDIMAMYQLNAHRINLELSAFVATGGAFSKNQIINAMNRYSTARAVDCFDNDLAGRLYGIKMEMLLEGRNIAIVQQGKECQFTIDNGQQFSIDNDTVSLNAFRKNAQTNKTVAVLKANPNFKDWNDMLMGKRMGDNNKKNVTLKEHNIDLIEQRHAKITAR